MKVQYVRVSGVAHDAWVVLDDDDVPVEPIKEFLAYCQNIERSPNTLRSYAHHLKLYWEFLRDAKLDWTSANVLDKIAEFVAWLRCPSAAPFEVILTQPQAAKRQESTVNAILSAVASFYEYHERVGAVSSNSLYRLQTMPRQRYKSFLHHITKSKPVLTRLVKLKEPKRLPKTLRPDQVKQLVDACPRLRDQFLISLLYETGMRIGQALGLRHEDVKTWANTIRVVPRPDNPNGARAKQVEPYEIHVSTELMALYRDYLVSELGEASSEYVFINLWEGAIGQPMQYPTIAALFRRLSTKTGLQVHPHLLRHTHATELIRSGWDAAYVQKRLGHAQIQTTLNIYTHLDSADLKQAYQEFQATRKERP